MLPNEITRAMDYRQNTGRPRCSLLQRIQQKMFWGNTRKEQGPGTLRSSEAAGVKSKDFYGPPRRLLGQLGHMIDQEEQERVITELGTIVTEDLMTMVTIIIMATEMMAIVPE